MKKHQYTTPTIMVVTISTASMLANSEDLHMTPTREDVTESDASGAASRGGSLWEDE